jgi:hypothetical protein
MDPRPACLNPLLVDTIDLYSLHSQLSAHSWVPKTVAPVHERSALIVYHINEESMDLG